MRSLWRAEWHRQWRKERAQKRLAFISNPYRFTKKLLRVNRSGQRERTTGEINAYLIEMLKDPNRHQELGENTSLVLPVSPSTNFDLKEPTWNKIQSVIRSARLGSALGPNRVPYIVYKRCLQLLCRLWKLLKIVWRRGKITGQWRYSEGIWTPEEGGAKRICQFRCISLLKEGKKFLAS